MSWNGYFSFTPNFKKYRIKISPKNVEEETDDNKYIQIILLYPENIGSNMKKNRFEKEQKNVKENVCFITCFETKKTGMFAELLIAL